MKWTADEFWSTPLSEWLMMLSFLNRRNSERDDDTMTRDRIAELQQQYPDGPRKPKNGPGK